MKNSWIITQIIKLGWADITLNMQSCKTKEGCALHGFHIAVLIVRGSATETGNPVYNNTHVALAPSKTRAKG